MDKILEKVRKLIQLATDEAASEGERDNALRMAHGLLAKHNREMADLEKHIRQEGRMRYGSNLCPQTRNFAVGAVDALELRVDELIRNASSEGSGSGTSLVLVDYYKSEAEANRLFIEQCGRSLVTSKSRPQAVNDSRSYNSGREYGATINLSGQVKGPEANLRITNRGGIT